VNLFNRLPAGGAAGQVLTKSGACNYAAAWASLCNVATNPTTDLLVEGVVNLFNRLPTGGAVGQALIKTGACNYAAGWTSLAAGALVASGCNFYLSPTSASLAIGASSARQALDVTGNAIVSTLLGVGTAAPAFAVDLGPAGGGQQLSLRSGAGSFYGLGASNAALLYQSGGASGHIWYTGASNASLGTARMALTATGLGLSTTAPAYAVDLGAGGGGQQLSLLSGAGAFYGLGASNAALLYQSGGASGHVWYTGASNASLGTARMALTPTGLGVAQTSPAYALDVSGGARVTGAVIAGTPVQFFYRQSANTATSGGAGGITWSHTAFTFQTAGSLNTSNTLFASDATIASCGTVSPVITLPYSGVWALCWWTRFNSTTVENATWFAPMASATYGETGGNSNGCRLGNTDTTVYNGSSTFVGYFASGDTVGLATYSGSGNSLTTNSGPATLSAVLIQRTA
jgi:hypothetical protein